MSDDPRFKKKQEGMRVDGLRAAAEILNGLDEEHRKRLLLDLYSKDPGLTKRIEERMYTFEDLSKLSEADWRVLLAAVPRNQLVLALRRAPEGVMKILSKSLTSRALESLKEEVASLGPKRVSDIQAAQQAIAKIAIKLKEDGKIASNQ